MENTPAGINGTEAEMVAATVPVVSPLHDPVGGDREGAELVAPAHAINPDAKTDVRNFYYGHEARRSVFANTKTVRLVQNPYHQTRDQTPTQVAVLNFRIIYT